MIPELPLKLISFFIVIIMILIIPILYQYKTIDTVSYNTVYEYTDEFVAKCATQGQVTKQLFEQFINRVSTYGIYKVTLEHQEKEFVPDPLDSALYQEVYVSKFNTDIFDNTIYKTALPSADRVYNMSKEDYFVVTLKRENYTFFEALRMRLTGLSSKNGYYIRIGEIVKNEHQ